MIPHISLVIFTIWLVTCTRNAFDATEISADLFFNICDVTFDICAPAERHVIGTLARELPLEQWPSLRQAGDPIEKHTDLLEHGYIIVVYILPFLLESTVSASWKRFQHLTSATGHSVDYIIKLKCVASLTLIYTRSVGTLQPRRPKGLVGSKFNWPSEDQCQRSHSKYFFYPTLRM